MLPRASRASSPSLSPPARCARRTPQWRPAAAQCPRARRPAAITLWHMEPRILTCRCRLCWRYVCCSCTTQLARAALTCCPGPGSLVAAQLKQSNINRVKQLVEEISDPTHPSYGQYLSREEVTALVAPPQSAVDAVVGVLRSHRAVSVGEPPSPPG